MQFYSNKTDFIFYDDKEKDFIFSDFQRHDRINWLFGYAFLKDEHLKNESISEEKTSYIQCNNVDVSGIYCSISKHEREIVLTLDPLNQYNLFCYNGSKLVVSSSLEAIVKFLGRHNLTHNSDYLLDQLAYQSPLRGNTLFNEIKIITYDELRGNSSLQHSNSIFDFNEVKINIPDYNKYDAYSYDELLSIYISRLNGRAKIISEKFSQIHIQLTGGADSRLVMSSLQQFDNVYAYVYGDGNNQNRLIYEELVRARNIKKVTDIKHVGKPLTSPSLIIKGLKDTDFLKFNNLNTYMNGSFAGSDELCKVTGYYGANVCGGVVLPPSDTEKNPRLTKIPKEAFTYHDFVSTYKDKNSKERKAAFSDLFYINNRGKSHYSAHSIADNRNINSVDILYDYINLLLVKKCPYNDLMIDKNAISVDLIYENDPQLAMFPYDSRKIPHYRSFSNIPLINCFEGYNFPARELESFRVTHPTLDTVEDELYFGFYDYGSTEKLLRNDVFDEYFSRYPYLEYLRYTNDVQANIFLYYCLSLIYFSD